VQAGNDHFPPSTERQFQGLGFLSHYSPIDAWLPKNIVVVNQKRVFDKRCPGTIGGHGCRKEAAKTRGWDMSRAEAKPR
jgi:hypothetical protein